MAEPALPHQLKKRLHKLRERLAQPENVIRDGEKLHALRVALKEWRAALRLLHGVEASFPLLEIQARFKPVFAAAGELRFWELQRGLVNRMKPLSPVFVKHYRAHVRSHMAQSRKNFLAAARAADLPQWGDLKQAVGCAAKACTPLALKTYFDTVQADMLQRKAALNRRRRSGLHELRKDLREYSDNRKLVIRTLQFDPGPPQRFPEDSAWAHTLLGDWHDLDAACIQLYRDLRQPGWKAAPLREGKAALLRWRKDERAMWSAIITVLAAH